MQGRKGDSSIGKKSHALKEGSFMDKQMNVLNI